MICNDSLDLHYIRIFFKALHIEKILAGIRARVDRWLPGGAGRGLLGGSSGDAGRALGGSRAVVRDSPSGRTWADAILEWRGLGSDAAWAVGFLPGIRSSMNRL